MAENKPDTSIPVQSCDSFVFSSIRVRTLNLPEDYRDSYADIIVGTNVEKILYIKSGSFKVMSYKSCLNIQFKQFIHIQSYGQQLLTIIHLYLLLN